MKEFVFIWNIENIGYSWHKSGEWIISPPFTAGPIENSIWRLKLCPRGSFDTECFSLLLQRYKDKGPQNISINFELSCISAGDVQLNSFTYAKDFSVDVCVGHPNFVRCHEVFITRKALYLPRDVLRLRCRMWKDEGTLNYFGQSVGHTRLEIERILLIENTNLNFSAEKIVEFHSKSLNNLPLSIRIQYYKDWITVEIYTIEVECVKFAVLKLSFIEKTSRKSICQNVISWLGAPKQKFWMFPYESKMLETGNDDSDENIELLSEFVYSNGEETNHLENDCTYSSGLSELVSKYIISCTPCGNQSVLPEISQQLWNLYVEQFFCDLEIKTKATSLFVHKIVLCARSPVFLAMLTNDMKEKRHACIELEDIADDILEKFLHFLYTDSFQDLEWEEVIGLYYAADKYQIQRLKILCCSYLLKNIDIDNVSELLLLADEHNDSFFKNRIDEFVLQNDEKIFSSSTWKRFVDEEPFLSSQTMLLKSDKEREKEDAVETYEEMLSKDPDVQEDLVALYIGEILSDIVIKTANASFPTHKAVLCASSLTLMEKFTKDIEGNLTEIFETENFEDDTVSRLLLFLYADSLGEVQWDTAIKLYHAASVYQIHRLKFSCSCFLLENLKISNAGDLLLIAHDYCDVELKSVVVDYILMHDEEIFGSNEWADFSETNCRLANETMRLKYKKN